MNMPISKTEKRGLIIDTDALISRLNSKTRQPRTMRDGGDYAESDAGRDRRQQRRNAIARKREFLA